MITAVCYSTGGEYAASAAALVESGQKFGVAVRAVLRPDLGEWWANVAHKPGVIASVVSGATTPVLYLDADCRIVGPLTGLAFGRADVLIRHRGEGAKEPYNGGVMFFKPDDKVRKFVAHWRALVSRYGYRHETCDQRFIDESARACGVVLGQLPPEYNVIPSDACPDPRITHSKVSRADPALSAWKAARRLEDVLVARAIRALDHPAAALTVLWGPHRPLPSVEHGVELQTVDRYDGSAPVATAWYSNPELWYASLTQPGRCANRVCSTDFPDGDTLSYLRGQSGKPSDETPPPYLGLFYPTLSMAKTAARGELAGPNPWVAAVNALALRGASTVRVSCQAGMRNIVADACKLLGLRMV